MRIGQVNMVAVTSRGGFIGSAGELPTYNDAEQAHRFQHRIMQMCEGGQVVLGGRTHKLMLKAGLKPQAVPFEIMVWDRKMQSRFDPLEFLSMMQMQETPIFILGGRYTFQSFAPYTDQVFLSRVNLRVGAHPLFMPDLFSVN